ncbi:MAG: TonB-dependent receptor [Caulobacter sp.]|nr:TonB-dependent receptor [Caulobacter sp.]
MNRKMALLCVVGCITPSLLHAQERTPAAPRPGSAPPPAAAQPEGENEVEALVVTGQRQYGAVLGDITPEETFNAADVRALGVSSITDLLAELSPQTTSGRGGSPVVLLNGRRISGMGEIRDIPTEAIQRVEVLPEEVALKYGYSAEQKVVNIVLRQRFRANTAELGMAGPTEGGQTTEQLDVSSLRLNRDGRLNLAAKVQHSDELLESDRDLVSRSPAGGEGSPYRSLLPRNDQVSVNAVLNRVLKNGVSATVNGSAGYTESNSLLGETRIRSDLDGLEQNSRDLTGHFGFTLDKQTDKLRWSLTGNYDHTDSRTLTDRDIVATATVSSTDRAHSISDTANLQLVANGALARLPAGDLSATVKLGAEGSWLDASSWRGGVKSGNDPSRTSGNAQISLDLPITSRKNDFLAAAGDLSVNLNLAANHLSDFGTLTTVGYGATWSPVKPVSFIVSMTQQETAPTMSQLGGPMVYTPDVRVFDFVKGETVNVIRVSGGNPDLKAEEKRVLKLGVTFKPTSINGLSLNANYFRTRIDDPISGFPAVTAETEAAFPDRFTRVNGQLVRLDARSVNLARQESDQVRWGINFTRQIGKTPPRPTFPPGQAPWERNRGEGRREPSGQAVPGAATTPSTSAPNQQAQASDQPQGLNLLQGAQSPGGGERPGPAAGPSAPGGGDRGFGGPGGFRGGPGGFGGGFGPPGGGAARLQLALYHTIHLRERVYLDAGAQPLDLLNGDALNSGGGQPKHEIEAQAGVTKNGLGARLTASWQSATEVNAGPGNPSGALRFSDVTTVNLRLFANLSAQRDLVAAHPFLRGTRVTLALTNLFDEKPKVRDANGATPINYQPDYLDPLGRSLKLSVRKVFF